MMSSQAWMLPILPQTLIFPSGPAIAARGEGGRARCEDGSTWEYGYNDRSEVTSATRRTAGGVPQSFTRFWYAKATATPAYDLDGNLLSDARNTTSLAEEGRWVYTWDAENRLIQMETPASYTASSGFYTKLTFEYNWEGSALSTGGVGEATSRPSDDLLG